MSKQKTTLHETIVFDLASQTLGYEKAEITLLLSEKKGSKDFFNLLTLIELVPADQPDSPAIGAGDHPYVIRQTVDDYTIYAIRIPGLSVDEALTMYTGAASGLKLNHHKINADVRFLGELTQNPPGFNPLLIDREERQLGRLLPHRHTACRVWSQLNMTKDWLQIFDDKFFRKLSDLSKTHLGYDLAGIPEHIGNIYLFGCNPLLRSWDCHLIDYEKDLLIRFHERVGKSIAGCKLVLEEVRGDNNGFYMENLLGNADTRIALPYFPDRLHIRLFDPHGRWIDHNYSGWVNFAFDLAIHDRMVDYRIQTPAGIQVFSVPKRLTEKRVVLDTYDRTAAHYLQRALAERRFEDLAESKEFIFFPKAPDSSERAKEAVRELLNGARERCMILDPYFGAIDMPYIYKIENVSLTVQIISSLDFLNRRSRQEEVLPLKGFRGLWRHLKTCLKRKPDTQAKTFLEGLFEELQGYEKVFPQQKIECRVLRGGKSPLHDRFIIIDDRVYLLGSSFNEFGSRTTTIIRVPTPEPMIAQALAWWKNDDDQCPFIADYVEERRDGNV